MNRLWKTLGLSGVLALAACAARVPVPTPEMAGGDPGRLSDLAEGRRLYVSKCSGCHRLFNVDRFTAERWTEEVQEMIRLKKVRLTDPDRERLLLYLTALAAGH